MFGFSKNVSSLNPLRRDPPRINTNVIPTPSDRVTAEAARQGRYDKTEAPLSITDVVTTCLDVVFGPATGGESAGYAALGQTVADSAQKGYNTKNVVSAPPNPLFVSHGHSRGDLKSESPATLKFLERRRVKDLGGNAVSIAGSVSVAASLGALPVNAVAIAKQANATISTAAHLTKLKILAREIDAQGGSAERGVTLSELVREVIKVKAHKSGIEGSKLVAESIPLAGGIVTGSLNASASAVKTFDKAYHAKNCAKLALEIHWRAYQEQFSAYCRMHKLDPAEFFAREDYLARKRPPRLTGMGLKKANEKLREADRPPRLTGMGLAAAREALEAHDPPKSRLPSREFDRVVHEARQSFYFHRDAGPATSLVTELYSRRSALAVLGGYDISALIMEPGGWVALTDKIASL